MVLCIHKVEFQALNQIWKRERKRESGGHKFCALQNGWDSLPGSAPWWHGWFSVTWFGTQWVLLKSSPLPLSSASTLFTSVTMIHQSLPPPPPPPPSHETDPALDCRYAPMCCLWQWWSQLSDGSVESGRAGGDGLLTQRFPGQRLEVGEMVKEQWGCFISTVRDGATGCRALSSFGFEWVSDCHSWRPEDDSDHQWWHSRPEKDSEWHW